MSKVFTLGYAARGAGRCLDQLMTDPSVMLIDIRYSGMSRFHPAFRAEALKQQFQTKYCHVPQLGNINYKDHSLPIVLADPVNGLVLVQFWLANGYAVCLLCACSKVALCHRSVVAALLQDRYGCEVVHL